MWALSALGFYDFDVYDRILAKMVDFNSKDPRSVARVFYAAALALHFTENTGDLRALHSTHNTGDLVR